MSAGGERKDEPQSKVALSENEERFRLLIDSLQDYSVFPLSVEGRVSNWNLGAERLKGYTTEEALGLHISRFFPEEENAERVPERILNRAETDGRAEYEGWLVRKDKSQFWGTVVLSAMRDQAPWPSRAPMGWRCCPPRTRIRRRSPRPENSSACCPRTRRS
jgi:PAS domain S-box-containing protein